MNAAGHSVVLLFGSNIAPRENLRRGLLLLSVYGRIMALSSVWETRAVGADAPNFLNCAVIFITTLDPISIKREVIAPIEKRLGRVRGADKFAPRTMDIDIIVYDGQVLDPDLWNRLHVALPVSELMPDLRDPQNGATLKQRADELLQGGWALRQPGVLSG